MSVMDENRRACKRCGKLINHWTDNLCDKNMCKIQEPETHIDLKRGWYDVGDSCQQNDSEIVQIESVYGFQTEKIDTPHQVKAKNLTEKKESIKTNTEPETVRSLHDKATKIISDAIGEWIKRKDDSELFDQMDFAKSLRIAANYMDGVSGA